MKQRNKTLRKKAKPVYDLYNGDQWDNYRLGDVLYGHFICYNHACLQKVIKDKKLLHKLCDHLEFSIGVDTPEENKEWCIKNTETWADRKDKTKGYLDTLPIIIQIVLPINTFKK